MKKALCLLLALALALSFAACGENPAEGENTATTTTTEKQTTTQSETTVTTTTTTTKATTTTTKPQNLNPKTNFKFGTYKATFFKNNKQSYHEVSLYFHKEFDTVQINFTNYYTIEQCKKQYEYWGETFDETEFMSESQKNIGGVTYYDIGDWGGIPESYELTDKLIKAYNGEFSLNQNGTLTLEKDHNMLGQKGTIYTFSEE